ncbi:MAG: aminotransferase class V-fold PLP-dependent enzyme [Candidatus Nanohaloarchaea archaeon]
MGLDASRLRKDFPALQQEVNGSPLVYLDNAATAQKPQAVIDRISRFYEEENANVGRSLHELGRRATEAFEDARRTVQRFINASSSDEVVFTRNTTEAMNAVASSLEIDGKIVVPEMAHHSNQLPWRRKAEREDLEIDYIPTTEEYELDMEAARKIIDGDTAVVSVSHVSNVFGCVNPVKELAGLAHENDAYLVVDAAQSVPRMPVDVQELDVDFLAFSGHKMLGPTGSGVLYARKPLLEDMEPYQVGGGMIRSVKRDTVGWAEPPEKFQAGTPDIASAVGLAAAIEYIEEIGRKEIHEHEQELVEKMVAGLREIDGVELYTPEDAVLVSFTMEGAHPHDISEILDREGVAIRAGHHCAQPQMESLGISGTARASPYLYNTGEDVDRFLEAVEKVKEVFS